MDSAFLVFVELLWSYLILGSGDKQLVLSFYSMLGSLIKFV